MSKPKIILIIFSILAQAWLGQAVRVFADPGLAWNAFLGSAPGTDWGNGVAVDGNGNVYLVGTSSATWGAPVRPFGGGPWNAFVVKLDGNGNMIWNTFLGGAVGEAHGTYGIAVDGNGNVYAGGISNAGWGTPRRAYSAGGTDVFAAKLDSNGQLLWNTFLGGADDDGRAAVAVDGNGQVYVTGYSTGDWGTPIRAFDTATDAFAVKLDSNGNLLWNTFLGGAFWEDGNAVAVDEGGNVYVGGTSGAGWGTPMRAFSGNADAFVAKLDGSGALAWNTFLGGADNEWCNGIAVDQDGQIIAVGDAGATWGTPARAYGGGPYDVFSAALSGNGVLAWHLFLGGSGDDEYDGSTVALDHSGGVYAVGYSNAAWGNPVRPYGGGADAFAAKILETAPIPTTTTTPAAPGTHFTLLHSIARPGRPETIRLLVQLDQSQRILLEAYDLAGRKATVVADARFPAGTQELQWDGAHTGSGLYILRARAEGWEEKFKVVVLK